MRRALIAGLVLGATGAFLGVFVVQRASASSATAWPTPPSAASRSACCSGRRADRAIWVALPFTVVVALGISAAAAHGPRRRRGHRGLLRGLLRRGRDVPGPALGRAGAGERRGLLFGSLLAVSPEALRVVVLVSLLAVAVLLRVGPRLAYATFEPSSRALSGVRVAALESLLLALTALVVVVGAKTIGVVLVAAFMVIPAATAQLLGRTLGVTLPLAVAASLAGTAFGLFASYHLNVAPGATIILTLGAFFFSRWCCGGGDGRGWARGGARAAREARGRARARAVAAVALSVPAGTRLAAGGAAANRLTPRLYGLFLDLNFRRLQDLVYRPQCDACRECRELRVDARRFRPRPGAAPLLDAQRRRRRARLGRPLPTDEKHTLYQRYLEARHDGAMSGSKEKFRDFLHAAPEMTHEVVFRAAGRLVGAASSTSRRTRSRPSTSTSIPSSPRARPARSTCSGSSRRRSGAPALAVPGLLRGRKPAHGLQGRLPPARDPGRRRALPAGPGAEWR